MTDPIPAMRRALFAKVASDKDFTSDELWQAMLDADPLRKKLGAEAVNAILEDRAAVVPVEPTEAMWTAGRQPILYRDVNETKERLMAKARLLPWFKPEIDGDNGHVTKGDTATFVWRSMLATGRLDRPDGEGRKE